MIDIHAHILPGVDDGSPNMDESLLMAEQAEDDGVTAIIATPHCNLIRGRENYWGPELAASFNELQELVSDYGLTLKILPGMEIFGTEQVPELIREGLLIGLNHTNRYLIEFEFTEGALRITRLLNALRQMDIIPIVAHPERYDCVQTYPDAALLWTEMGCELQINKGSVFGKFGQSAWECASRLLDENLVTYLASDAHSSYRRTTRLEQAWEFLAEEYSPKLAQDLLVTNPGRLLQADAKE